MATGKTPLKELETPSIAIGLSVYQDYESLQRCIPSFVKKVDLVIVVYGRYQNFGDHQYKGDSTTAETHRYLEQFPNIVTIDLDPSSQVSKRNTYLEVAAYYNMDIVIVIDADEWIEERTEKGGWEDFRKKAGEILNDPYLNQPEDIHNLYGIWERYGAFDQFQDNPRVILRPEQCEYYYHHNWVKNKSKGYRLWCEPHFSEGIVLRGNNTLRTKEREDLMNRYEAYQTICDEHFT